MQLSRAAVDGIGPHVSFDASGLSVTINSALAAVRPGGTAYNVAIWETPAALNMGLLLSGERSLRSGLCYAGDDYPSVIAALADQLIEPSAMITGRIALADVVEGGFSQLIDNREQHVKILVRPRDAASSR